MQGIWHGRQKLKDEVLSVHIIRLPLNSAHTPSSSFGWSGLPKLKDKILYLNPAITHLDSNFPVF